MGARPSIVRKYLVCSLSTGLAMGAAFPPFSTLFVENFRGEGSWIAFCCSCVVAGLGVGWFSFLVGRATLLAFAGKMARELEGLSDGTTGLGCRLQVESADVLGELAFQFNRFLGKVECVVATLASNAGVLAVASSELSAVSDQIASNSREAGGHVAAVAASSERSSAEVAVVAGRALSIAGTIETVSVAIAEMSHSIKDVARNCQNEFRVVETAAKHSRQGREVMKRLGDAASEIGSVVGIIDEIAEKTKLLALNASIEAARSGQAGKGFAVVAGEVKELAKQTAGATNAIRRRIADIQEHSGSAVASIEAVADVVEEVNSISHRNAAAVEQQSGVVEEMASKAVGVERAARRVAEELAEASEASRALSDSVVSVHRLISETGQGNALVREKARHLAGLSAALDRQVAGFSC